MNKEIEFYINENGIACVPLKMYNDSLEEIERLNNELEKQNIDYGLEIERLNKRVKECEEAYLRTRHQYSELEGKYVINEHIINELEKWLESESNFWKEQQEKAIENGWLEFGGKYNTTIIYENAINKLKKLKGDSSND